MSKHILRAEDLAQFSGSDNWYQHWTKRLIYTDGVMFMAEKGGAHWLIDLIASYQGKKRLRTDPLLQGLQIWELKVKVKDGRRSAVATCKADTGMGAVIRQKIEYTDFPLDYIKLYVVNGRELCLPSER